MSKYFIADFTTANYRRLLKLAKKKFVFRTYADFDARGAFVLWRHDVDMSPHRALALARIEHRARVRATYFVHLHSLFYNAFEPGIVAIFRHIAGLGHAIGLHFESAGRRCTDPMVLAHWLRWEAGILEKLLDVKIAVFSFHNPTAAMLRQFHAFRYGNLINTYSRYFRTEVSYCSDSNGYWRHERLEDVLRAASHPRLQVLSHPEWWQDEPLTPRNRVQRCIKGRATSTASYYDDILDRAGRKNIR